MVLGSMGGAPDMGGDDLEDIDVDSDVDIDGGAGMGDMGGGEEDEGDVGMGVDEEESDEPELEGYDIAREKRLLLEIKGDEVRRRRVDYMQRLRDKYRQTSCFGYLLESKELDGLPKPRAECASEVLVEGLDMSESSMMIGWSVPVDERNRAIDEIGRAIGIESTESLSGDITKDDLPGN